jgi:hypothetical protein
MDCIACARAALAGTGWPASNATGLMNLSFLIVGTSILFLCKSLRQHVARFLHLHIGDTIVGEYK